MKDFTKLTTQEALNYLLSKSKPQMSSKDRTKKRQKRKRYNQARKLHHNSKK